MRASLPVEIRFESIGGLGAHLASQLLAESLVLRQNLNASQFSSFGSEKKGTPVRSSIRAAEKNQPIRVTSPVTRPDVLAVFHEALLARPATLAGLKLGGVLVVNAPAAAADLPLPRGRALVVDAMAIAMEEQTRINTAILGAVAKACPLIDPKALAETLEGHFGKRSPKLAQANGKTFWRGYREAVERAVEDRPDAPAPERGASSPRWGYFTAPLGGAILEAGNTAANDLSVSRQGFAPRFNTARCVHCGVCDLVCPDYCFVWEDIRLMGIDYQYCKGCLRCVESCPSGALTKEREGAWTRTERVPLRQQKAAR
ncbi:MAG: 2-oxoacid:acceptor oxidoreductase family protein [Candidatus Omnitrophica bacterium]|nr:2-oxoacid:acceptor oxidoreductase family protein [Candidatus Omnitrophota bacterium]